MRDSRLRKKAPGTALSSSERASWKQAQATFMKRRAEASENMPAVASKRIKMADQAERLASWDWLLAVQNALTNSLHWGLEHFVNTQPERGFDDNLAEGEKDIERVLVVTMDQEQKQWCAGWFLQRSLNLNIEFLNGPFHRRWNDLTNALCASGLYNVALMSLFINNVSYGPWQKGGFFNELVETGQELMCHLEADDDMLLRLWPAICRDHEWDQPAQCDRSAREEWIRRLPSERPFAVKGLKASPSRWFTIVRAIQTSRTTYHTKLLGLVLLALRKGWVGHWEDLFSDAKDIERCKALTLRPGASPSSRGGPQGASASTSSSAPSARPSAAAAKAAARQSVATIRQKSVNALHGVARLMADPELHSLQQMIRIICGPMQQEHSDTARLLKGEAGTMEYYALQAAGHWHVALACTIGLLNDLRSLGSIGFTTSMSPVHRKALTDDSPEVTAEDNLASTMWRGVVCILSHRCASMSCHSLAYPFVLGGLNSDDPFVIQSTFNACREHWEAYAGARRQPLPLPRRLAERSTLNTRCMESTCRIIRQSDYTMSPAVKERCEVLFKGWGQERIVEDALKHIRESEMRDNNSRTMGLWRSFEVPKTVGLMAQYDRPELKITNLTDVGSTSKEESLFHPNTIASEAEDKLHLKGIMDKQSWDTFNATTFKALAGEMNLLLECHRRSDWSMAAEAWRAAVLPLHQVVVETLADGTRVPYLTLFGTMSGVLVWPMDRVAGNCFKLKAHALSQWKVVFSLDQWAVLPSTPISPLHCFLLGDFPSDDLGIMIVCKAPVDIMTFQASRGFQGVPEMVLTRLCKELGLSPEKPQETAIDVETFMAAEMMKHILPTLDQSTATEILMARLQQDTSQCDAKLTEFATDEMIGDVVLAGDQRKIKRFVEDMEAATSKRSQLKPKVIEHAHKVFPRKGRAPAASSVAKAAEKLQIHTSRGSERWWANIKTEKDFLDKWRPCRGTVIVDNNNGRFLLVYPNMKRRSVSWTLRGIEAARLESLRILWQWHESVTPEVCPLPAVRALLDRA